jgi:hypothetical protein
MEKIWFYSIYCYFHVTVQSHDLHYLHFWQIFDELYLL